MATTRNGTPVRCPVYMSAPSRDQKPGCGSADVTRLGRPGQGSFEFECNTCGDWFDGGSVDFDRAVLADPRRKSDYDKRLDESFGLY